MHFVCFEVRYIFLMHIFNKIVAYMSEYLDTMYVHIIALYLLAFYDHIKCQCQAREHCININTFNNNNVNYENSCFSFF